MNYEQLFRFFQEGETGGEGSTGGTGSGGSGNPGADGGGSPGSSGPPAWKDFLAAQPEDVRGFVEMKGYTGFDAVVNSYKDLEKAIGIPKEELLRVPKNGDPEIMKGVWERLGKPADPKEYVSVFGVKEGESNEFAEAMAPIFDTANLTKSQAEALAKGWNEYVAAAEGKQTESYKQQLETEKKALSTEWGQNYESRLQMAKEAMKEFGITPEQIAQIEKETGFASTMKLFASIGERIGEDSLRGGEGGSDTTTPAAAKAEIQALKADKAWVEKYMGGDKEARDRMAYLQSIAHQGEVNLDSKALPG